MLRPNSQKVYGSGRGRNCGWPLPVSMECSYDLVVLASGSSLYPDA